MSNRMSIATVSSPEFINITGISPFASKCEIKVFYLGQNRNGSFINKEVASTMAQTLPGCPIVGYYSEDKEDFRDHGDQMIIDGDGIKFRCQTVPYGFVAPDAKVWFKDFEDTDEFGNTVTRTYLMTEGYLWTEQYEEAQKVINEGRPQSMELDTKTLKGYWSTDNNRGIDFFIINDAIFSKLCILGEDVEPCFEGASVTSPDVSSTFSKDENFTKTLYSMLKELKELTFSLQEKGGNSMALQDENIEVQAPATEEVTPIAEVEENVENSFTEEDKTDSEVNAENQDITEEFAKKEEDPKEDEAENSDDAESKSDDETEEEDDKKEKAAKNTLEEDFALVQAELSELKEKFTSLQAERDELAQFKADVEDKEKDNLINSFYMLSDEEKKDVMENKSKYTLDEIEAKLSVICVRNKVSFAQDTDEHEDTVTTVFNLDETEAEALPAWLKAVENRKNVQE